jgi:hypothetical protein
MAINVKVKKDLVEMVGYISLPGGITDNHEQLTRHNREII